MDEILVSWIGGNDLAANLKDDSQSSRGPVLSTLQIASFSKAFLLYNYPKDQVDPYIQSLKQAIPGTEIKAIHSRLSSPIHFGDIHQAADELLNKICSDYPESTLNILLSPGTPAMQAVWILLGKTKYPAVFYQSSVEQGVQKVEIPFDIAAEFLPDIATRTGKQITNLAAGTVPINAAFDDILTTNPQMEQLKAQATIMAQRDVPVLIYGETGTGKELFATAIHNASHRRNKPFIPVNCGAIPSELIDSVLFGHIKGAFTGAISTRDGYFKEADGGTLFLDEFGELPLDAQVRLLRVVQSGELTQVGASTPIKVDVRIVAATNRNLIEDVATGKFREDLFYRIAVGVLHLPPIRDRKGDLGLISEAMLEKINQDAKSQTGYKHKVFSVKAKNLINNHLWKGNIRELYSTILRASLWSEENKITENDIESALFKNPSPSKSSPEREINNNFNIQDVIDENVRHYIEKALKQTGGNRTKAAEILGLSNYQTLNNWMKKYGISE
jgi:transcriptional regulator with PAS, ATPase and Fis domain